MIHEVMNTLKCRLEEYITSMLDLPDSPVLIGRMSVAGEDEPGKLVLSVINIERETAMGVSASSRQGSSPNTLVRQLPPWYINMDILVASVFDSKLYAESLKMLSLAIGYFQSVSSVSYSEGRYFTIEMVTLNVQELTNVWSLFGGRYYPSMVCKIRMLAFDGNEIHSTARRVTASGVKVGNPL